MTLKARRPALDSLWHGTTSLFGLPHFNPPYAPTWRLGFMLSSVTSLRLLYMLWRVCAW